MTSIVESTYTEGSAQVDGRRYVKERHVDDAGESFEYEWLGDQNAQAVVAARASVLNTLLTERAAAEALVSGTLLPLTKYQFRQLFGAKQVNVDAFNATYESSPGLSDAQKSAIRTGLKNFEASTAVVRPFVADVIGMLALYVALGILTQAESDAIAAQGE
jgi:hypothetical protein